MPARTRILPRHPTQVHDAVSEKVVAPVVSRPEARDHHPLVDRLSREVLDRLLKVPLALTPGLGEQPATACPDPITSFKWDVCAPVVATDAPVYNTYFNEELHLEGAVLFALGGATKLLGAELSRVDVRFGVLASYAQSWFVTGVRVGDLEAVRSLAPGEEVEIELRSALRRQIDRTRRQQQDVAEQRESVSTEKEILSVMQSAAASGSWTESSSYQWNAGLRFLWLNAGVVAGSSEASQEFSRASTQSMQTITENVARAAQSVRTQSKIEVRGVTETVVTERNLRRVRNPYQDRSLLLKVFSVIKSFRTSMTRSGARLGLSLTVQRLNDFTSSLQAFALGNRQFLKNTLLDDELRNRLDDALQGIREIQAPNGTESPRAVEEAKRALELLFADSLSSVEPNRVLPLTDDGTDLVVQFLPNSFFQKDEDDHSSGVRDAKEHGALDLYMILYAFYREWRDIKETQPDDLDTRAVPIAAALARAVDTWWIALPPEDRSDLLKSTGTEDFSEIFRRVPGFKAYYDDVVAPLVFRLAADERATLQREERERLATRLVDHLKQFADYYAQELLHWAQRTLGPSLFAAQVRTWLASAFFQAGIPIDDALLQALVPPQGIRLRDNVVVVTLPFDTAVLTALEAAAANSNEFGDAIVTVLTAIDQMNSEKPPEPLCLDIDVPVDGSYLEAVPGQCLLPEVPVLVPSLEPTPTSPPTPE